MEFGERLAAERKAKGLSQDAFGKGLGCAWRDGKRTDAGKQVVLGWEKGRHFPKVDQLVLICKLGCSSDYLLFGTREGGAVRRLPSWDASWTPSPTRKSASRPSRFAAARSAWRAAILNTAFRK
jgi:transcriptional regulator with XRE-family HTH domain